MISGSALTDGSAILMVTFLLPLAMYSMRGTMKRKTLIGAAISFLAALTLFLIVGLSLVLASYHKIDYDAAAGNPASRETILPNCAERNVTEGRVTSGRNPIVVNIAGPYTGVGWWRQAFQSFAAAEGLTFDEGGIEQLRQLDCQTDVFLLNEYSESSLLEIPRPFKASLIVRDPRSVVAEVWLKERAKCGKEDAGRMHQALLCNKTEEASLNSLILHLHEQDCTKGPLSYLCTATSLAAQAASVHGLRIFKYESFWTRESAALVQLGRWYGLEGDQLQTFLRTGRMWLEEFHNLLESSLIARVRKPDSWSQYFTESNRLFFQKHFGSMSSELGYGVSM